MLIGIMLSEVIFIYHVDCHYAECRHTECRGTIVATIGSKIWSLHHKTFYGSNVCLGINKLARFYQVLDTTPESNLSIKVLP